MAETYAYAVGSISARETRLLTRREMEMLCTAADEAAFVAMLHEHGFGASGDATAEQILSRESAALWDYLKSIVGELTLFTPFFIRRDVHNVKAVIKGTLTGKPYADLLMAPCTVDTKELRAAVEEHRFDRLPAWLAAAAEESYKTLSRTGDAPLADAILDAAGCAEMLAAAGRTGVGMLVDLMTDTVFYADVKIALRAARAGKDAAFVRQALCPVEGVDVAGWTRAICEGVESTLSLLETVKTRKLPDAVAAYRQSPTAFEKWVDDRQMTLAREYGKAAMGPEPVLGYYIGKDTELRVLHLIASGVRTGQNPDEIAERVRMLYGK